MKCKNTNNKCNNSERIKPIDGQGSFQGYDVFQCPKCKEVATTVKKSDIKKGLPEGISPSSNPRTKAQMISENNSDEFRDYAKRENITPKETCPNCDIGIDDQNKRGQPACGNCGKPPSAYDPDQYEQKSLAKQINKFVSKESCPSCGIEATEGNEVAGFKCPNCDQQPRHHPSNFAHEDLGDNTGLPSRINKFVSKSGEKIFGDMGEQKPFMVEGEPDKINYYGRKTKLDKSIKKAIDTPLYSIKKDNPDPDAAYDEMRERRSVRKPKIAPDLDAMKDDVDVEKWRPSKGAGAAIGGGTGAIIAGPLGAAGGAYLGHKLGRDKVKKAVPGWESTPQNTCPTCGQTMPDNGMECAAHSNVIGLASRINNFVDKGRDFQTKGERREQTKRPRMPMHGRSTGDVYRNAVEKRAPKPSKKIIEKSNPRIYDNGGETIDRYTLIDRQNGMHGFNSEPYHPQGFGQFAGDFQGGSTKHLGKKVHISTLSPNAQKFVNERNGEAPKSSKKMGNINKAGAPILPCKSCGKQVPHFKSSPPTTQGLCSECVRTSLTKPNTVKKAMWNNQKVCTTKGCGWKQGYDIKSPKGATIHQAANCPKCGGKASTKPFSPDF